MNSSRDEISSRLKFWNSPQTLLLGLAIESFQRLNIIALLPFLIAINNSLVILHYSYSKQGKLSYICLFFNNFHQIFPFTFSDFDEDKRFGVNTWLRCHLR